MRNLRCFTALTMFACLPAVAGTLIVSGDSSIGNSPGGNNNPPTGGNATFFKNVLGSGTNVLIQDPDTSALNNNVPTDIATYYNSLAGVSAIFTTSASITNLSGVNLFISMMPQAAYTSAELSAMNSFLSSGGTLFLIGEAVSYVPGNVALPFLNTALSSLGSSLMLVGASDDMFPTNAIILPNPLTVGVTSLQYGFTSHVTGGTVLFETAAGAPFVEVAASASIPEPGSVTLILGGIAVLTLARLIKTGPGAL